MTSPNGVHRTKADQVTYAKQMELFDAAQALLLQSLDQPTNTKKALERLSAAYFWRAVSVMAETPVTNASAAARGGL
jgi:hypothetical protein